MYPRLIALAGPHRGTTYPLTGDSMSIGRESTNWICVSDSSASRKHCLITRTGDSFLLTDLDSRNGTSIDGIPIKERMLQHGDQIKMGDSIFLFLLQDQETAVLR